MNIFADTSGWASLLDTDQEYHLQAASIYNAVQQSNRQLITTNYVITELVALLNSPMRYPREKAVHFVNGIKNSKFVRVVHIDETLDNEAWDLLSKRLQRLAQCLTRSVEHWRPKGVATDSGFHRSERAKRVNEYENRCKVNWRRSLQPLFQSVIAHQILAVAFGFVQSVVGSSD